MKQFNVIYSTEQQHAVADAKVIDWYADLLHAADEGNVVDVHVATNTQLNELRIGVKFGEIAPFDIIFNDDTISCDEKGNMDDWPDGFFNEVDIQLNFLIATKIDGFITDFLVERNKKIENRKKS